MQSVQLYCFGIFIVWLIPKVIRSPGRFSRWIVWIKKCDCRSMQWRRSPGWQHTGLCFRAIHSDILKMNMQWWQKGITHEVTMTITVVICHGCIRLSIRQGMCIHVAWVEVKRYRWGIYMRHQLKPLNRVVQVENWRCTLPKESFSTSAAGAMIILRRTGSFHRSFLNRIRSTVSIYWSDWLSPF